MNIYEKLSAITGEISAVAKNLNVGIGQNQYKAVGEADVLAAVKPIEAKYKIYSYPAARKVIDSGVMTSEKRDRSGAVYEVKQNFMRIETVYRFVDTEDPASYIEVTTYGDGVDAQDKAPGKAMTYADKYALLKAYKILTGEDPDQKYSEPLVSVDQKMNAFMKNTLVNALKEHGKKAGELKALEGKSGYGDMTVEDFRAAMKELGEE